MDVKSIEKVVSGAISTALSQFAAGSNKARGLLILMLLVIVMMISLTHKS